VYAKNNRQRSIPLSSHYIMIGAAQSRSCVRLTCKGFDPVRALLTERTIRFVEDGGEAVGRKIDSTEVHP
jgi:hypothetical protein